MNEHTHRKSENWHTEEKHQKQIS